MAQSQQQAIKISGEGLKPADGVLHYTVYDKSDRTKRALAALGLCWAAAGVTVFIPIAHFILVPGFFIAGPILAGVRYKQAEAKEKVEGTCPKCEGQISVSLEANDTLPKWTYCPSCDASIQLKG